jgi:hypothetical protein
LHPGVTSPRDRPATWPTARAASPGRLEARRLDEPLERPGNQRPPGEAARDAPEPRDAHGDLVARYFVSHVKGSVLGRRDSASAAKTEFPLVGM